MAPTFIFSHLNARKDYRLFLRWMAVSNEIPAKTGRVAGLSRKDNRNFWLKEQNFNYYLYKAVGLMCFLLSVLFSVQLFLVRYDVDLLTYILVQTLNVFHCFHGFYYFNQCLLMTQVFCLQIIYYFSLKFMYIADRLSQNKKMSKRRLARLIHEYQTVQLEVTETNDFFKNFMGINMLYFFISTLLLMFLSIFIGWPLRIALFSLVVSFFLTTIVVPFAFSNLLLKKVIFGGFELETRSTVIISFTSDQQNQTLLRKSCLLRSNRD